jgi:DNA-binding response OmpR family regulator
MENNTNNAPVATNIEENIEESFAESIAENTDVRSNEESRKAVRRKIVIVDDVQFQLLSAIERLRKYYDVYPAQSAEDLFKLLEKITPELILLDVYMPDSDGHDTVKMLKEDSRFAEIPVIFLSAKYDKKNMINGMKNGAVDFVKKPFSTSEIRDCIERHLDPEKRKDIRPIILAVDDSPSVLKSVSYLLEKIGKVYTLPNPNQLVPLLKMVTPDLFLLDCNMPDMSGFDLVPIIRKMPEHEDTPIVFLTALGTPDNVSVALSLGVTDFITKPIVEDVLREKIALNLRGFIMSRRIRSHNKKDTV